MTPHLFPPSFFPAQLLLSLPLPPSPAHHPGIGRRGSRCLARWRGWRPKPARSPRPATCSSLPRMIQRKAGRRERERKKSETRVRQGGCPHNPSPPHTPARLQQRLVSDCLPPRSRASSHVTTCWRREGEIVCCRRPNVQWPWSLDRTPALKERQAKKSTVGKDESEGEQDAAKGNKVGERQGASKDADARTSEAWYKK